MGRSTSKYRAIENEVGEIFLGVDADGEPEDMSGSTTDYPDWLVCHEETSKARMKDKIKDKKIKDTKSLVLKLTKPKNK